MTICIIVTSILAAIFMYVRITKARVYGLLTKTLASLSFVFMGVLGIYTNSVTNTLVFLVFGMVLGLLGDIFLDLKRTQPEFHNLYLMVGMSSFALGHIVYFVALLVFSSTIITTSLLSPILISAIIAIPIVAIVFLLSKPLKLDYGKFLIPSITYAFILVFMTIFSTYLSVINNVFSVFAVGMVFFLLSDLVLSTMYFGGKADSKMLCVVNHSTYYIAQILIASLLFLV